MVPKAYTVESVTSGHPDKVCDQISDAILDACLGQDPTSRVAVEAFGTHGHLIVGGEVTTAAKVQYEHVARSVYENIGYTEPIDTEVYIAQQSPDIAQGVDTGGAGDQGIMYGYATDETKEFLPSAVVHVHALVKGLERLRRTKPEFAWLRPDGKAQITMDDGKVSAVLVSTQHAEDVAQEDIRNQLIEHLITPTIGDGTYDIFINPTGNFVLGGFAADTGLTGRKIMVDTYCGIAPHGGGAFSGKDPTKVDRSAAYMARFAAKNMVAHGFGKECSVAVAYAIGRAEPMMLIATNEKGEDLSAVVRTHFDFRPKAIIERLQLRRPIYQQTAAYGHFGKDEMPWEQMVPSLSA